MFSISLQKLFPIAAAAFVTIHGQSALGKRLSGLLEQPRLAVVKYNMSSVLRTVQMMSIDNRNLEIPVDPTAYIRNIVESAKGDPAKDPWSTPYKLYRSGREVSMISAGPDKNFDTGDDIKKSIELLD